MNGNGDTRIRDLNDALRERGEGGLVVLTRGVRALDPALLEKAWRLVSSYDEFEPDNDPYGEHDFGVVEVQGNRLFFKIDAYDESLAAGSPDPADPAVTTRVLTIMLAEEY